MRSVAFTKWVLAAALLLALAAPSTRAEDKKKEPVNLGLDDLGIEPLPSEKKAKKPAKTTPPPAATTAPAAKKDAAPGKTPDAPKVAPEAAAGGVFVAAPPPAPEAPAPRKEAAPAAAPPLLKLSMQYGIAFPRTPLVDEAVSADVESGLKTIAFQAPMSQRPTVLHASPQTQACGAEDDSCFALQGAQAGLDEVIVASLVKGNNALQLRVRRVDVLTKKRVTEAVQGGLSSERIELKAWSEALLCKLIVPSGCMGDLLIETGGAQIQVAEQPLPKSTETPERFKLPVGVHPLRAQLKGKLGPERLVAVLREPPAGIAATVKSTPEGPRLMFPGESTQEAAPVAAVATQEGSHKSKWNKPVGYIAGVAGLAALVGGAVVGLHSKSQISSAEDAYHNNGGAYRPADLANLQDGNSSAKTANILFVVGGILAATGFALALAF